MALTSSLNCLSCRSPYQSIHSLNAFHSFSEKALFFTGFCFVASPSPNTGYQNQWVSKVLENVNQKNVRNPNHHYFSKKYRDTPPICIAIRFPICIAVLLVPLCSEEREILSVLLPFVSQYASCLYCSTPPICIAVLLGKSWWLWSPECSPIKF